MKWQQKADSGIKYGIFAVTGALILAGCGAEEDPEDPYEFIRSSLTFYASYDESFNADFARGDPNLYITTSWDERTESFEVFTDQAGHLQIHDGEGRYDSALRIDNRNRPVFFYSGKGNMPYERQNWNGTVSFWMRVSPDDIPEGFSDPIQITSRRWNDGALFVDFTDVDPRIFRYAAFPDREVWDPEERDWGDVPHEERLMVDVSDPPFHREEWSHVAFVFRDFNTRMENGRLDCYLNGEKMGTLGNREQTYTWDLDELGIWVGYNYRGYIDELSIFDRALNDEEIVRIFTLENGIRDILDSR